MKELKEVAVVELNFMAISLPIESLILIREMNLISLHSFFPKYKRKSRKCRSHEIYGDAAA
jgi:hypothetical protein